MKRTALLCLLPLLLVGCSSKPLQPPAEWLAATPAPTRVVVVNRDIALLVKDYQASLQSCNADKQDVLNFLGIK